MELSKSYLNKYLIITLFGRLDSTTSQELEESLNDHLEGDQSGIVLDFKDLDYISSAGLRVILNVSKFQKSKEKDFILCGLQDHILEIFEISGFDLFVDIRPSLEDVV